MSDPTAAAFDQVRTAASLQYERFVWQHVRKGLSEKDALVMAKLCRDSMISEEQYNADVQTIRQYLRDLEDAKRVAPIDQELRAIDKRHQELVGELRKHEQAIAQQVNDLIERRRHFTSQRMAPAAAAERAINAPGDNPHLFQENHALR